LLTFFFLSLASSIFGTAAIKAIHSTQAKVVERAKNSEIELKIATHASPYQRDRL
jgi:hypothetical protein